MTKTTTTTLFQADRDGLEARFGVRVASLLGERAAAAAPDISERLRFAREQALAHAQAARRQEQLATATAPVVAGRSGSALLLASPAGWWIKLGSVVPLALLVLGLMGIARVHERAQIAAVAEVDAELLSDALPPTAYSDPGFAEYLKTSRE